MKEKMKSHPYLFLAAVFALLFLAGNELAAVCLLYTSPSPRDS